jgi:hypothetical protein
VSWNYLVGVKDGDSTTDLRRSLLGERVPLVLFVAIEATGLPLLLWYGRGGWFVFDEWDLLAERTGGNLGDLFRPHYQHWLTLPIIAFRLTWQLFGIRTYVPYQLLSIVTHLTAAALLFVIMRRASIAPWLATVYAGVLVFFGTGANNILYGFLIAFVGAFVFGMVQLVLADHDGPIDRRDRIGLLFGLCGLMCSGVAVSMVVVVGLAALIRRGWRAALFHTAPLGAAYVLWLAIIGRHQNQHLPFQHPTISEVIRFVAVGLRATFGGLGQLPGVGLALALALLVGLPIAYTQLGRDKFRQRAAAPIALLIGAIVSLFISGTGRAGHGLYSRAGGPEYARQGRYVYLAAAMVLPALAFASNALLRRWRAIGVILLVLPILGLPGNLHKFNDFRTTYQQLASVREKILIAPRIPLAGHLPRSVQPDAFYAPGLTLGWLIDGVHSGRVPAPQSATSQDVATVTLQLALMQTTDSQDAPCSAHAAAVERVLQKGQSITVETRTVKVVYRPPEGAPSRPVVFGSRFAGSVTLIALAGPLPLRITTAPGIVICG